MGYGLSDEAFERANDAEEARRKCVPKAQARELQIHVLEDKKKVVMCQSFLNRLPLLDLTSGSSLSFSRLRKEEVEDTTFGSKMSSFFTAAVSE